MNASSTVPQTLALFQSFVERHAEWFRGYNSEAADTIQQAEAELGQVLPHTLKWLLNRYGYWRATGLAALPYIVSTTRNFRPAFPPNWVILSRLTPSSPLLGQATSPGISIRGAGFVVLVLEPACPVDGKAVIICDAVGSVLKRYSGFSAYVIDLQQAMATGENPFYRTCLNSFHRQTGEVLLLDDSEFDLIEWETRILETWACAEYLFDVVPEQADCVWDHSDAREVPLSSIAQPDRKLSIDQTTTVSGSVTNSLTDEAHNLISAATRSGTARPAFRTTSATAVDQAGYRSEPRRSAGQAPGSFTPVTGLPAGSMTYSQLRGYIQQRRETVDQHFAAVPRNYRHHSSSNRGSWKLTGTLPEGKILIAPVTQDPHHAAAVVAPSISCLPPLQHISLLQAGEGAGAQLWLTSWVAPRQEAELILDHYELTRTAPQWLLTAGEPLSELIPRLRKLAGRE